MSAKQPSVSRNPLQVLMKRTRWVAGWVKWTPARPAASSGRPSRYRLDLDGLTVFM